MANQQPETEFDYSRLEALTAEAKRLEAVKEAAIKEALELLRRKAPPGEVASRAPLKPAQLRTRAREAGIDPPATYRGRGVGAA